MVRTSAHSFATISCAVFGDDDGTQNTKDSARAQRRRRCRASEGRARQPQTGEERATWQTVPQSEVKKLQRPLTDGELGIVHRAALTHRAGSPTSPGNLGASATGNLSMPACRSRQERRYALAQGCSAGRPMMTVLWDRRSVPCSRGGRSPQDDRVVVRGVGSRNAKRSQSRGPRR